MTSELINVCACRNMKTKKKDNRGTILLVCSLRLGKARQKLTQKGFEGIIGQSRVCVCVRLCLHISGLNIMMILKTRCHQGTE